MNIIRLLAISFLWALSWQPVASQTVFQNIKWQDGLSAKQVRSLYRDSSGFLWIGTSNGLNRYDGAVVRQYKYGTNKKNLFINAIQPLNGQDTLLVGLRYGVLLFDKRSGAYYKDKRFDALEKLTVLTIKEDPAGRLWIGTTSQIFIYQHGRLMHLSDWIPAAGMFSGNNYILSELVIDKARHGFWVAGSVPYFVDYQARSVYHKSNNIIDSPILEVSNVNAIAVDAQNNVWFGCDQDASLNYWDALKKTVDRYLYLDGKKISEGCNHLFIDSSHRLWISTWLFAAFIKEPGQPIRKLEYDQNQAYTIGYGHFRDAIQDEDGNVWLGTINGVSKSQANLPLTAIYRLPNYKFFLETGFAHASHISVDEDQIVACKEDGIIFFNTQDRTHRRYKVTDKELIRNRFVMSAKAKDTWWFAGNDGIYFLKKGAGRLKRFEHVKAGMPTRLASFVFVDQLGKVWFHIRQDALYRYDPLSKRTDRFDGKDKKFGVFAYGALQSFIQLRKSGDILFSIQGKGLLRFQQLEQKFKLTAAPGVQDAAVAGMVEDKEGKIWTAPGGKGLIRMDARGNILDSIDTGTGLAYDYISGLAIDGRGVVWGASREGLVSFDPASRAVTKLDIDLGKTLQDYYNFITVSHGKVYAVMLDHILVIDPLRFAGIPVKRPPYITSVQVFGKEKTDYLKNPVLELSPNEDFVSFQYASLQHRDIPSLQYSYQLEGLDQQWVSAGRSIHTSYTNLLPGQYTFKVRSTDQYGAWMSKVTSLRLLVKPNWWQTWWFYGLCLLSALIFVLMLYQAHLIRTQKRRVAKTIDYFANSVYGDNSVTEICWDIARNCISQLRFEDCVVYLVDETSQVLEQKAAYGHKNPKGYEIINPIKIPIGNGLVGTVARTGKPLLVADTSKDERYIVDDQVSLSEITVPIVHEGKVIAVIDSEHSQRNFFNKGHLKALTTVAAISANKIAEAMAKAQAQQQELLVLEIKKMLAESQLMALRAQMNPHFIFNCLNSIQECIVTRKYAQASKYLNKFSKLFRMVLNNSGKNLVSVQDECQVLSLYLDLELMRFDDSFTYEIVLDPNLDEELTLLPSMLLQPYVENALWHGLMHKDGERSMRIEFTLISEDVFMCRIRDNGIGRQKSFEIKASQSKSSYHQSQGLRISQDRVDLLKMQGSHADLRIVDQYDENGIASGTLVEVELSTYLRTT